MRIDVTRQPGSFIITQFVLLLGLFWYRYTNYPLPWEIFGGTTDNVTAMPKMPLGRWLDAFAGRFPVLEQTYFLILVSLNAFIITRTISRNLVYPARTYIPAIFYLIVCCGIFYPGGNVSSITATYLILQASVLFISSFIRSASFGTTFKASLLIGTAILLYANAVICLLLIPIAMRVFRRQGREFVVSLSGAILPIFVSCYVLWASGGDFSETIIRLWEAIIYPAGINFSNSYIYLLRFAAAGILILLLFLSFGTFISTGSDMRTRAHKISVFMIWFMLIASAGLFLPSSSVSYIPLLAIPAAFVLPAFFVKYPGRIAAILYLMTLALILSVNIIPLI